ncbi:cilia- and flagella-associated protein 263 [Aulostomus maculatus]
MADVEGSVEQVPREQTGVEELQCSVAALLAENDMLERFIRRLDAQDQPVPQPVGEGPGTAGGLHQEGGGHGWRRRSRPNMSDGLLHLTLQQKLHVAQREVAETRQDQENFQQRYESLQENYKVSLQEAELRLAEIRKARSQFELRMLKPMKLEMMEPDKVLCCIVDNFKAAQLEKFKLKNQALKAQEKKLQQQLHQKKEMAKAEYEETFQEYSEQRADKNPDELKVRRLKAQRALRWHKEMLHSATLESTEMSNDITKQKKVLDKMEEELKRAEEEHLKAEALNQHLRRQMTDYQAPDISQYMQVKDKHKQLQQSLHKWGRKVQIAEMDLKLRAKAWNKSLAPGASRVGPQSPVKLPHIAEAQNPKSLVGS